MNTKTAADMLADAQELIRKKNLEINQKNKLIHKLQQEHDTAEEIRKVIFEIAARPPAPPKWLKRDFGHSGKRGGPSTIWSDWHWGEVIRPAEIGGVNEFNSKVAQKRANKLVETTIDLCFNHMGRADTRYPGIVVCLGGDMIGGDIHEELMVTNDRTSMQSVNDLTDCLAAGIDRLASVFGRVFLPCIVGNHGRSTHKPRAKTRVITNYDWSIYCNLERCFRKTEHVQFFIPSETDAYFTVYGHRYLLTHGDTLGVRGGDGIIGALGPIMRGMLKTSRSEGQIGREFDTLLIGHWHQYLTLPGLIVNNSLKGYDEYARLMLRAPYSRPSQALWFTHPEHGITAHWQVYLEAQRQFNDAKQWITWAEA